MILRWFRNRAEKRRLEAIERDIEQRLAVRRQNTRKRSQAAQRGHSTELRNRTRKAREVMPWAF